MASSTNSVRQSRRAPPVPAPAPDDDAELRRQVVVELLKALVNFQTGPDHGRGSIQ